MDNELTDREPYIAARRLKHLLVGVWEMVFSNTRAYLRIKDKLNGINGIDLHTVGSLAKLSRKGEGGKLSKRKKMVWDSFTQRLSWDLAKLDPDGRVLGDVLYLIDQTTGSNRPVKATPSGRYYLSRVNEAVNLLPEYIKQSIEHRKNVAVNDDVSEPVSDKPRNDIDYSDSRNAEVPPLDEDEEEDTNDSVDDDIYHQKESISSNEVNPQSVPKDEVTRPNEGAYQALPKLRTLAIAAAVDSQPDGASSRVRRYYQRSMAVKAYILARAAGSCENCGSPAPFARIDGSPYLETHHTDRVSDGGPDHPANVAGICPTCHRRIHYGVDGKRVNDELRAKIHTLEDEPMECID